MAPAIEEMRSAVESMEAVRERNEQVARLRAEARRLWDEGFRLQRESYLRQAEADEIVGDLPSAEFHRALGTEGADHHRAYVRLRAHEFLRDGEHYEADSAEVRAEVEREAARIRAQRAPLSDTASSIAAICRPVTLDALLRLRAKEYLRRGGHAEGETPERMAEIEEYAARLGGGDA